MLVLVVVMAVYAGLERNIKDRLLSFTPHVLLQRYDPGAPDGRIENWREAAEEASRMPGVQTATAFVSYNVILDTQMGQRPVQFRAIDTSDPAQVEGITNMLDMDNHPDSKADLGLEDRAVISSILADQLGLRVGDKVNLYSTRNFDEVIKTFNATESPAFRDAYPEDWKKATASLESSWKPDGDGFTLPSSVYREVYGFLYEVPKEDVREPETELIQKILFAMDESELSEDDASFRFDAAFKEAVEKAIAELNTTDPEKMDGEVLKGIKSLVLPKEAVVAGVYQASQMAVTPDVFLPLHLGQDLVGLEDAVQGIALRLEDPYKAEIFAAQMRQELGSEWSFLTWGEQYQAFFSLIEQQRGMMYFMLSFIILISAFSMMAVMFTVTIQKRREIGVMKALGAAPGQIVRVFLYQGMILGSIGAVLGVGLGRLVIHFRGELQALLRSMHFDPFAASFTGFTILPAHNNPKEQIAFAIMAFVLCSLAAIVPAFFAARSDAAKSLRNL